MGVIYTSIITKVVTMWSVMCYVYFHLCVLFIFNFFEFLFLFIVQCFWILLKKCYINFTFYFIIWGGLLFTVCRIQHQVACHLPVHMQQDRRRLSWQSWSLSRVVTISCWAGFGKGLSHDPTLVACNPHDQTVTSWCCWLLRNIHKAL